MPLVTCPDCGDRVSTLAKACPHCGRPMTSVDAEVEEAKRFDEEYNIAQSEKVCPYCDQEIPSGSLACPWCMRDLTTEEAVRRSYRWTAARVGCAVAAVLALAIYVAFQVADRKPRPRPKPTSVRAQKETVQVDAVTLGAAYAANEIAADQKYKGRQLVVSGTVNAIRRDVLDSMYVTLAGSPRSFREVQCFFSDQQGAQLAQLSVGQWLTVTGRCDGLFGNVLIRDCRLK